MIMSNLKSVSGSAWTREEYMSGDVSHHEYYLSIAIRQGLNHSSFSDSFKKAIINSKCEHFNDIPLSSWDKLALFNNAYEIYRNGKRVTSLSAGVCMLKALAFDFKKSKTAAIS